MSISNTVINKPQNKSLKSNVTEQDLVTKRQESSKAPNNNNNVSQEMNHVYRCLENLRIQKLEVALESFQMSNLMVTSWIDLMVNPNQHHHC